MIPMMYRYTQSSHPRSGIVGCLTYTVVSLSAYRSGPNLDIVHHTWTRGVAFLSGVVAAVLVNWLLWPFVARHELRQSLSGMMLHAAILYRGVIARYVYHARGQKPTPADIQRSEMLEGRVREGFVRIRQLMELTKHEIRLRAPFDAGPYALLISSLEQFFDNLVSIRQSSLYFETAMLNGADDLASQSLIPYRRDAVAAILMNLYVLAGALRSHREVPRYLPSAAVARKRLLDRMMELEIEGYADGKSEERKSESKARRWADVYRKFYASCCF